MSRFSSLTSKVFTLTPKVLANLSPGLERSDNPGIGNKYFLLTLKGFLTRQTLSESVGKKTIDSDQRISKLPA